LVFIEIEHLTLEPLHFQHVYGKSELPFKHDDAALEDPVSTDFVLTHKDKDLRVEGYVQAAMRLRCARCLREFAHSLDTRFDLFYLPQSEWKKDEEIELKYEEMVVGYYDGISLDVDLMVMEQIELAMPMRFVCRADCKGLCPSCGTNLNEELCSCRIETADSRLAVLRDFRSKMKQ
jgi:uncharacterized protein